MKVYVGQTRSAEWIGKCTAQQWGEMACPTELPPRRAPWALDNGAFKAFTAGTPFPADAFERAVDRIERDALRPDFIVCPDIVAGGNASLEFSVAWSAQLRGVAPLYLAVQDGMDSERVADSLEPFAGIFVGGTRLWKVKTGGAWVELARRHGLACHVGRVGTYNRVWWARWIGADSIDSCFPLWCRDHFYRFVEALEGDIPTGFLGDNSWGRIVAEGMGAKWATGNASRADAAPKQFEENAFTAPHQLYRPKMGPGR